MIAGGPRPKRWTLEEYRRFVEIGAIDAESRVEFVEGEIIEKMGQNFPHIETLGAVAEALRLVFGPAFHVREARPIRVEQSEPEPDVTVLAGHPHDYRGRHPLPEELALLVEVSDSTLAYDRGRKAALYARGGLAEYWIVDLNGRHLIVHRGPLPDGSWTEIRTYGEGDRVAPLGAPDAPVAVGGILPPDDAPAT